ncbi:ATP-binding protein [Thiovibrio frasassiensis]|uniref:histidine kinase n=1 Tax=Thiovibrio frasassiensis TaxID=2984131 RepID=A0A9X4RPI6_9BACT|nr:ATP-binding protein [Thiovibrio frasassiensis]MDG4475282.1 ATP-binding protein [Thiovibrio frasassiensis]
MKFRFIFLALGLLALGATITGGAVYFQTVNALIHDQERKGTLENIEHLDKDLSSMINTTQNAVTVLAKMWSVQNFFNTQRPETTADVYLALDDFREAYGATRCCLINREGRVIAASSDNAQVQIGDDYSLQPFFPKTLAGKRVTSLTQGVRGQEPAINLSHPIFFKDRVLGVALLTVPLVNIEEELVSHATGLVALTDEHNFVFASNRRGWRFKLMGAATADDLAALAKNRPLMGEAPLQVPLTFNKVKGTAHAPNGKKYLFSRTPLSSTPGWQINYFQEEDRTKARLRQALFGKTGMLLAGMTLFIFGAIAYLFRQAELFLRQREEAEQKVKSANLFLAQILDVAADGMRIVDNNCNIVRINKTFAAMTGMDKEDILGKKCHEISWSPYCNKKKCPLQQIRAGKKRVEYESAQESPTGKIINCWIIAVPLHDINGTFIGILESFRDITEKLANELAMEKAFSEAHTLAEELAASNDQLHRQQRNLALAHDTLKQSQAQILQQEKMASVGQLAAGVAHEINNPMGFIGSNLSSLAKYLERITEFIRALEAKLPQEPPDEELAALRKKLKIDYIMDDALHLVEESLDGADRVKKIVQGLKNFSRVDQAERVAADINECLDSTLNIVWNELKYKCEVKKEYGELPPTVCNPQQLNQMFMNLLVNAAQAIETRGEIKIKTWGDQDWIYTRISDTGSGIPEDKIKRIFEPFYTSKEVGKGTGLGLSIVYDIVVKNHHGDIQVESEVGKGTSFTVKIPVIVAEPAGQ